MKRPFKKLSLDELKEKLLIESRKMGNTIPAMALITELSYRTIFEKKEVKERKCSVYQNHKCTCPKGECHDLMY